MTQNFNFLSQFARTCVGSSKNIDFLGYTWNTFIFSALNYLHMFFLCWTLLLFFTSTLTFISTIIALNGPGGEY